jgi:hypothetical protein
MRQALAEIDSLSGQIACARFVPAAHVDRLERQLLALAETLETYLSQQECRLFPAISALTSPFTGMRSAAAWGNLLKDAVERASRAQQEALAAIDRVQACLSHPEWTDQGLLVEKLIDKVHELEVELTAYRYVQEEVIFPLLRDLEERRFVVERATLIPI